MTWTRVLEKIRKIVFGLLGLIFLGGGLVFIQRSMPVAPADQPLDGAVVSHITSALVSLYDTFESGVWAIVGVFIVGNGVEHIAAALKRGSSGSQS